MLKLIYYSGQKSTKHKKDSDSEPEPSPRKSPKRSGQRSSGSAAFDRPVSSPSAEFNGESEPSDVEPRIEPSKKAAVSAQPQRDSRGEKPMDYDQKENLPEMSVDKYSPRTPVKGGDSVKEPFTPRSVNMIMNAPQATSTPAPNGVINTGQVPLSKYRYVL